MADLPWFSEQPNPAASTPLPYCAVCRAYGSDPTPCPTCKLPTWDGLHQNGDRRCYMDEVPR